MGFMFLVFPRTQIFWSGGGKDAPGCLWGRRIPQGPWNCQTSQALKKRKNYLLRAIPTCSSLAPVLLGSCPPGGPRGPRGPGGVFVEGEGAVRRGSGGRGMCSGMCCSVMLCHAVFCPVMLCSRFRRGRGGRDTQGYSGTLGTTWGLAAAVCRAGVWPGGLF